MTYRDRWKFMHFKFMMILHEDFKLARASLSHCAPFLALEIDVVKLIFEEYRRSTIKLQSPDFVVDLTSQVPFKSSFSTIPIINQDCFMQILQTPKPLPPSVQTMIQESSKDLCLAGCRRSTHYFLYTRDFFLVHSIHCS